MMDLVWSTLLAVAGIVVVTVLVERDRKKERRLKAERQELHLRGFIEGLERALRAVQAKKYVGNVGTPRDPVEAINEEIARYEAILHALPDES